VHDLEPGDVVRHAACDFSAVDGPLPELPDEISAAVYCPGTITLRSFRSLQPADFRQDFELNLIGAVRFLQACQSRLQGIDGQPASVVLFSTIAVSQGLPMHASVAASKGAVEGLVRSLAAEWAPKIRVNAIAPTWVRTDFIKPLTDNPELLARMEAMTPLGRIAEIEDVVGAVIYLVSPAAAMVTGHTLAVDGGFLAQ
jgi:NAD(P)-dependent dehydrogenase (short-subunit alcohol dehydrogenase family)